MRLCLNPDCLFPHFPQLGTLDPLVKISLLCRHAPMVGNGAFNHEIDYITNILKILNLKEHQNCITGSRVTAILLNGWIFPI